MHKKSPQSVQEATQQKVETTKPDYESIATRAFELWVSRGCPIGSPEIDWEQAEQELLEEAQAPQATRSHAA